MMSRTISRCYAFLVAVVFACVVLIGNTIPVSAAASVVVGDRRTWGNGGMVGIQISNGVQGETVTVTVTVSGTLTDASSTAGSASFSGNTITVVANTYNLYWLGISFTGENLTGSPSVNISVSGGATPTPEPATPTPVPPTATPTSAPVQPTAAPVQPTSAPAQATPTSAPAPVNPDPAVPASTTAATQAPAPAADPAAVQPDPGVPAAVQPAPSGGGEVAPAPEQVPAADTAPATEPVEAAPVVNNDNSNNGNSGNNNAQATAPAEEETEPVETSETEPTEETTVPIVIMDAEGNLITVTPTPTPFPMMSAGNLTFNNREVVFPWKAVLISLFVIAVLGTRYALLKMRGLRGASLALEFIPGVSDIADKLSRRGTKIEQPVQPKKNDYSTSTSARAAEAAREAQQARAELAQAAKERAAAAATENTNGLKAPVKRPSYASINRTSGVPSASAGARSPSAGNADRPVSRPSPFKKPEASVPNSDPKDITGEG